MIILGLGVLLASGVMVRLGFWQLSRLAERRAQNQMRKGIRAMPLFTAGGDLDAASTLERPARAHGTFVTAPTVRLLNRMHKGSPGVELVNPFRTDSGNLVWVNRGWIPDRLRDRSFPPPVSAVTLSGYLFRPGTAGLERAHVDSLGPLDWLRLDPDGFSAAAGIRALPYAMVLTAPADAALYPLPSQLAALDEGPHLSYAIQWFSFAAIFLIGYLAWVRKMKNEE